MHDTSLERGSARVVVNPGATVTLFTPGGHVAMTRGEFRVHVDSQRTTRVVAYRGRARVTSASRGFFVGTGTGTRIDQDHAGTAAFPPIQVPRAPVWTQPFPAAALALAGAATVEARFAPPPGQRHAPHGWVVELARDAAFDDVVFERELPPTNALFRAEGLTEGEYFARVSSVDGERFESIPSAVQRFRVVAPRVIPGTATRRAEVLAPPGLFCRLDGDFPLEPGVPHALVPARRHEFQCSATADMANPTRVEIPVEQAGELTREVQLVGAPWTAAGGSGTVEIRLRDASGRPFPYANVTLQPSPGVTASSVIEGAERGVYLADVRWAPNTPLVLEVVVNGALRSTERLGGPPR